VKLIHTIRGVGFADPAGRTCRSHVPV